MRSEMIMMLKRSYFYKKIKNIMFARFPFLVNIIAFYRYSKWLHNYKIDIENSQEDKCYGYLNELNELCIKHRDDDFKKPIIIMTTYNDHDIIEAIIKENDKIGYEQIIIDNWSDDGTWEIIKRLSTEITSILKVMQFPFDGPTLDYEWKSMLDLKSTISREFSDRWILHQDSDEVTIMPFYNVQPKTLFGCINKMGFNAVSLRMLDFTPVDDSFSVGNPVEHFKYYRISQIPSYSLQNKIWFQGGKEVNLSGAGGHDVTFDSRKVFPIRLPRFHYSIRSYAHAASKYSPKRLVRSEKERAQLGWHTHVETRINEKIIFDKKELIEYNFLDLYSNNIEWFFYKDEKN